MTQDVGADKLVRVYIKIRDAKAALQKEYDDKLAQLDADLQVVEDALLEICKATGQDGGKTSFGSFTRSVKTRYWTSDWDAMYRFIQTHDAPHLLERRIHQGNFKEFLEANPGVMPEGLNADSKYTITVRRAK